MVLPTLNLEESYWHKGFKYICGIDEVGRGSRAGPLVVAGVILPLGFQIPKGLADSKLVAPKLRETLSVVIKNTAIATSIVEISSFQIDKLGLAKATNVAFRKVLN